MSVRKLARQARQLARDGFAEIAALRPWLLLAGVGLAVGFCLAVVLISPASFF